MKSKWGLERLVAVLALLLAGCAPTLRSAASAPWSEVRSEHFRLWTDGEAERGRQLLVELERLRSVLRRHELLQGPAEEVSPRILVLDDHRSMGALTRRRMTMRDGVRVFPGALADSSMRSAYIFINANAGSEAGGIHDVRGALIGMYVRHFQYGYNAQVPLWYDSAISSFISNIEVEPDGSYTWGCLAGVTLQRWDDSAWMPLDQLMDGRWPVRRLSRMNFNPEMQSWFLLHYLLADPTRRAQLRRYLESWRADEPHEANVRAAFAMSPDELDRAVRQHRDTINRCTKVTPQTRPPIPQTQARVVSRAEVDQQLAQIELELFGASEDAERLLTSAASARPSDPATLTSLARLSLLRAGAASDPEPLLARAEHYLADRHRAAPEDAQSLTLLAGVLVRRAEAQQRRGEAAAAATVKQARANYRRAIRKDERDAEAWLGLGMSYLLADHHAKEAEVALEVVAALKPREDSGTIMLARLHERRGQVERAMAILERADRAGIWYRRREVLARELVRLREGQAVSTTLTTPHP